MANYNPNLVKLHRNYTFEELADVFGIHKNTVSEWVKKGLPCLKEKRPFLILGKDARGYLAKQRIERKSKCQPNEFYCVRCKIPTKPAENFVEYLPNTATKGRLVAICDQCDGIVNKFTTIHGIGKYSAIFDLTVSQALEHIKHSDNPA